MVRFRVRNKVRVRVRVRISFRDRVRDRVTVRVLFPLFIFLHCAICIAPNTESLDLSSNNHLPQYETCSHLETSQRPDSIMPRIE